MCLGIETITRSMARSTQPRYYATLHLLLHPDHLLSHYEPLMSHLSSRGTAIVSHSLEELLNSYFPTHLKEQWSALA